MNWKLCIDTPEHRALKHCNGSMNEGEGWGYGVKIFINNHRADLFQAPKTGSGAGENHTHSGDGWGDGWNGYGGAGYSEKSWEKN